MRTVDVSPKAAMLIESMRDIGYSLETALADVIDNSITAGATTIRILAEPGGEARIGIIDDGCGMTEDELFEAMRPGSRNPLEDRAHTDLGRFGLGLKTASFSQARRLSVVTRRDGRTSAAIWDIDHVAATDQWLVQIPDDPSDLPHVDELGERGTLVLWEKLDRVVDAGGPDAMGTGLALQLDHAREHLELVFHRFLSGELGRKKVKMTLNQRALEPFDPFRSGDSATSGPEHHLYNGQLVTIQGFTLPHHSKVTPAEWKRNEGPGGYLKNQGFYVYRQQRLIIHGTWFGLARKTELTKLARVRIEIPNGLDAYWKIDIKKASAQPPFPVRERLRRLIGTMGADSKRRNTNRAAELVSKNPLPLWIRLQQQGDVMYRLNPKHPVLSSFAERLPATLGAEFLRVLELAAASLPMDALLADLGGEPEKVRGHEVSDESLEMAVRVTTANLGDQGFGARDILDILSATEPFRSNWTRAEALTRAVLEGNPS